MQKRVVKKGVVNKNGKSKVVLAVPKSKPRAKKAEAAVASKEDEDALKSSQTSVKSSDVSYDFLELSQESKSSQSSNSRSVVFMKTMNSMDI